MTSIVDLIAIDFLIIIEGLQFGCSYAVSFPIITVLDFTSS